MVIGKAEYWLLDCVADLKVPISFLISENIEMIFNQDGHGLSYEELRETLYQLFYEDLIFVTHYPFSFEGDGIILKSFNYEEIDVALQTDGLLYYYGLTAKGGAIWEEMSKPNWDKFAFAGFGDGECEIAATNIDILEQNYDAFPYIREVKSLVKETKTWEIFEPWQATYWKTLPKGYQLYFQYESYAEDEEPLERERPEWYTGSWPLDNGTWYTNFFDAE